MTIRTMLATGLPALVLSAGMAMAATITDVVAPTPGAWTAAQVGTVDTANTAGGTFNVPMDQILRTGSTSGTARSPYEPFNGVGPDGVVWQDLSYFSVGSPGGAPSPVTLSFGGTQTSFSLLWGSVDLYNSLTFSLGDVTVATITGQDVFNFANADPNIAVEALSAAFVTITGLFDTIEFRSDFGLNGDQAAFEFGSMRATPIPLPAPALLLLSGLGALGGLSMARRRRDAAQA